MLNLQPFAGMFDIFYSKVDLWCGQRKNVHSMEPEPSLHLRHKWVDRLNSKWLKNASCTPANSAMGTLLATTPSVLKQEFPCDFLKKML
jgi:hypothetical protein